MVVIAILSLPFIFYFTKSDFGAIREGNLGRIYGEPVTKVEFQKSARLFRLAQNLGMFNLLQDMTMGAQTEADAFSEFTWNRLILHHEAEHAGIRPSQAEIVEFVKTLRPFRNETGFDINKYNEFTQTALPALGFTEAHVEELVSDQLSLNRLKDLIGFGVQVAESESIETYEHAYGKLDVAVVRLHAQDFAKDVKLSDDDVAKYYEAHKAELKTDEKRRVEFVTFALAEDQKKLTGKERIDALQKMADEANDFTQALLEKDANFAALAIKSHAPLRTTGEFAAATPDPQLAADPQLTQYAFQLTAKEPHSDAIQGAEGFYVLHLIGIVEARPLILAEARPKIVDALKAERVRELLAAKGAEISRLLREALKSGTPLDKAVAQTGAKLERLPPFSLVQNPTAKPEKEVPKDPPDLPMIRNAISELSPGDVTDFVPTEKDGLVAVLEKREPIDPSGYQQAKKDIETRTLSGKRTLVFYEWLRTRRAAAGIEPAAPG